MKNLVKNLIKVSGITLTVITPLLAFSQQTFAKYGQYSSFQNSCSNLSIAGDTLSATCRTRNGSYNNTSIRIRGIANNNGNLIYTGRNRTSSYPSSCRNITIYMDRLAANCRTRNGGFNQTAIRVPGIKNYNGYLRY
ncbi:hypothetical protein NIES4071_03990 [Calothrix sp. NIES-4071]|nr:hypothetical protein NIES4071_03990 [Calothrix sp. NIES-4071]BAZ54745.1 hypothetical protein NIES4105_03980 [Calothrix sp. NIES-4105]